MRWASSWSLHTSSVFIDDLFNLFVFRLNFFMGCLLTASLCVLIAEYVILFGKIFEGVMITLILFCSCLDFILDVSPHFFNDVISEYLRKSPFGFFACEFMGALMRCYLFLWENAFVSFGSLCPYSLGVSLLAHIIPLTKNS